MMKERVVCVNERVIGGSSKIKIGETYFVGEKFTDSDGDTYALVYVSEDDKYPIGRFLMSHFKADNTNIIENFNI